MLRGWRGCCGSLLVWTHLTVRQAFVRQKWSACLIAKLDRVYKFVCQFIVGVWWFILNKLALMFVVISASPCSSRPWPLNSQGFIVGRISNVSTFPTQPQKEEPRVTASHPQSLIPLIHFQAISRQHQLTGCQLRHWRLHLSSFLSHGLLGDMSTFWDLKFVWESSFFPFRGWPRVVFFLFFSRSHTYSIVAHLKQARTTQRNSRSQLSSTQLAWAQRTLAVLQGLFKLGLWRRTVRRCTYGSAVVRSHSDLPFSISECW